MGEIIPLRRNPHDEMQELMPWFVNGSLAPDELARLEAHRAGCTQCRSDLSSERRLAAAVAGLSLECASAWERMRELLAHGPSAHAARYGRALRKRRSLTWAAPLAVAAALALVWVNLTPRQAITPQYHALGTAGAIKHPNLIVQFEPATRVDDVQRLLQQSNARLVDGPTVTGAYLLRVDEAQRGLALKQLRGNRKISLAEPIDAPPGE